MKKHTGHWLKRARNKTGLRQKQLAGDRFTKQYISQIETDEVGVSDKARKYITKKLKLPKSYFDTGLFKQEKERLDELIIKIDSLLDYEKYDEALDLVKEALSVSKEAKNDDYINSFLLKLARINIEKNNLDKAETLLKKTNKYYGEEKDYKNLSYSYYWT
jgi:transcriptional regulator with XRE-family HTH domain